jgi:conjugative transfer signal peptidase TraF
MRKIPATKPRRCAVVGGIGVAALMATIGHPPRPRVIWNASASAPIGLYWVYVGGTVEVGDMVIVRLPAQFRQLAAERHYLPNNVPLLKRVAAVAGDRICGDGPRLLLNGRQVAARLPTDSRGRVMPRWEGCETLGTGWLLLLTNAPHSFDGRYFGAVKRASIVGKAAPLWFP